MFDCKTAWFVVITIFMEHSTDHWSQIVIEAESAIQVSQIQKLSNENTIL